MSPSVESPVLIVGGGIGGLSAALALARAGFSCRVLERRPAFQEAGAGIQIGPNGSRILTELGVAPHIEPLVGRPAALSVRRGRDAHELARLPLGEWIEQRHGSPYWVAHRGDLHAALLAAAEATPGITLDLASEVGEASAGGGSSPAILTTTDGRRFETQMIVAADGLWSRLRGTVFGFQPPQFSGRAAARAVISMNKLGPGFWSDQTCIWLAPGAHVVHYPVRGGSELAMVVVASESGAAEGWGREVGADVIAGRTAGFAAELRRIVAAADAWKSWSLFDPPQYPHFNLGRVALLGDAAHPVVPFLAQGAVLALEDAATLAVALTSHKMDVPAALVAYDHARRPRAKAVSLAGVRNGRTYHMGGVPALVRDLVLSRSSPERLMAGYDWLYGWRAPVSLPGRL